MSRRIVGVAAPAYRMPFLEPSFEGASGGRAELVVFESERLDGVDLSGAEVLIAGGLREADIFPQLVDRIPRLRWVHSFIAGVDHLLAHLPGGVVLTNSAGAYASPLAEYCLWGITTLRRRFAAIQDMRREGKWNFDVIRQGRELRGARVGIVGYGATGRYVARACTGMGMEVWATRRTPIPSLDLEPIDRWLPAQSLLVLLGACDVVVLAASLNASTRGLIGARELAAMRPDAILVNLARGGLVDERALIETLAAGRLAGAVLDVFEQWPLPPSSPLWAMPNVVLTPHAAGTTKEAYQRAADVFCANLPLFLLGRLDQMANLVARAAVE